MGRLRESVGGAFGFLTILPFGRPDRPPGRGALVAFPIVGLVLGAGWAAAGWAAFQLWGALPAAAAILLVDIALTGGLHLDAVADLADGWASRKPAEGALQAMRDPAIGAVGATVLMTTLLARWSLLAVLVRLAASGGHWWLLAAPPVAGRAAMVWALGRSARTQEGTPSSLTHAFAAPRAGVVLGATGVGALAMGLAGGWRGLLALGAGALVAAGMGVWSRRRFGRLPGDAVGAAGIVAEVVALAVLSAHT